MPILKSKGSSGAVIRQRKNNAVSHHRTEVVSGQGRTFRYKDFCGAYTLNGEMISRLTGTALRTVAYWQAGKEPQRSSRQKLSELYRLFDELSGMIQSKSIGPWLNRSTPAFEGSTPLQVIERGEADRVWKMIWELREGHSG
jgi:hypothetical protein